MRRSIILIITAFILCSCTNDKPVPETKETILDIVPMEVTYDLHASHTVSSYEGIAEIRKNVIGKDVYVECIIPNFTFRNPDNRSNSKDGYLELYVDNVKVDEISTAAFIIKGLEVGEHTIRVEVKEKRDAKSIISEEFHINIQG